jgi:hypothetical protein
VQAGGEGASGRVNNGMFFFFNFGYMIKREK